MTYQSRGNIIFPEFTGVRCYMMPFIQGRGDSLPQEFRQYSDIVEQLVLDGQEGEIGLITIDESPVVAGKSQRGYGAGERTIHTEACLSQHVLTWGPVPTWGPVEPPLPTRNPAPKQPAEDEPAPSPFGMKNVVLLKRDVRVLIANSIADTCMVWDVAVEDTTPDGDLSMRASEFPRESGRMMASGEVMEIGIFTPHEPIPQKESGNRQFFRIVGKGVTGREDYFTRNEHLERLGLIAA